MKKIVFLTFIFCLLFSSYVFAIQIYNYSPTTGEYLNESTALLDPLETAKQGTDVPLVPAYATLIAPPTVGDNQVAVFESGTWVIKPDYRGQVYHTATNHKSVTITDIGDLPADAILGEYVKTDQEQLDDAIDLKLTEIDSDFITHISEGVTCTVNGTDYIMASTLNDVTLMDGGVRLAQKLSQTNMIITDFNDNDITVSVVDADAISTCMASNYAALRQHRNDLRNQVKSITITTTLADAINAVQAITW